MATDEKCTKKCKNGWPGKVRNNSPKKLRKWAKKCKNGRKQAKMAKMCELLLLVFWPFPVAIYRWPCRLFLEISHSVIVIIERLTTIYNRFVPPPFLDSPAPLCQSAVAPTLKTRSTRRVRNRFFHILWETNSNKKPTNYALFVKLICGQRSSAQYFWHRLGILKTLRFWKCGNPVTFLCAPKPRCDFWAIFLRVFFFWRNVLQQNLRFARGDLKKPQVSAVPCRTAPKHTYCHAWLSPERKCGDKFLWLGRKSGRRIGRNLLRIFVLHLLYRMTHKSSPKIPPNLSLHVLWLKIWNFISASFWGLGAATYCISSEKPEDPQKRRKLTRERRGNQWA